MKKLAFLIWGIILCFFTHAQDKPPKKFNLPPALQEVSGLVYVNADSLWWHNDSGNTPTLFLTNQKGQLLDTFQINGLENVDWEDLAQDTSGNFYIGDFGNNRRNRDDLVIYQLNPFQQTLSKIPFQFQEGTGHHDTEAMVWANDQLHLFTKASIRKKRFITYHYTLPTDGSSNIAMLKDSIFLKKRIITGAAIHESTGTLALIGYFYSKFLGIIPCSAASVFFFQPEEATTFFNGPVKRKNISWPLATQLESIDFVNSTYYYIANEKTLSIKPRARRKKWKQKWFTKKRYRN